MVPHSPAPSRPSAVALGREGAGVGEAIRCVARNARHPGTGPGQPAMEGRTLHRYRLGLEVM